MARRRPRNALPTFAAPHPAGERFAVLGPHLDAAEHAANMEALRARFREELAAVPKAPPRSLPSIADVRERQALARLEPFRHLCRVLTATLTESYLDGVELRARLRHDVQQLTAEFKEVTGLPARVPQTVDELAQLAARSLTRRERRDAKARGLSSVAVLLMLTTMSEPQLVTLREAWCMDRRRQSAPSARVLAGERALDSIVGWLRINSIDEDASIELLQRACTRLRSLLTSPVIELTRSDRDYVEAQMARFANANAERRHALAEQHRRRDARQAATERRADGVLVSHTLECTFAFGDHRCTCGARLNRDLPEPAGKVPPPAEARQRRIRL